MSFHDSSSPIPGDGQQIHIQPDGMVRFGNDTMTNVVFYKRPMPDAEKSRMAGRRIEVGVDFVRIQHPGERDTVDVPVASKPDAPHRWPRQWAQYRQSMAQIPEGTPTNLLPLFVQHPEIPANLAGSGVYTLEQLANLSEHAAQSIGMGVTQWRNMARDYLEKANKGVGVHRMEAELQKRDTEIEVLKNNLAQAIAQIDKLAAAQQGVPGAMIPMARPTIAQAQSAAVAKNYDWTQPPPATFQAMPTVDWTAEAPGEAEFDMGVSGVDRPYDTPDINKIVPYAPPQPTARPRGRPRKSAPASQGE